MMARFDEILRDCTKLGTKIPTDQYLPIGNYPIIDQGQTEIAGYYNNKNGLFEDVPAIIFGDHTRAVKYVDKPCFLGADGVKLLCPVNKQANVKYLYYQLQNADIPNTGYNRHFKWVKELDFIIPNPEEQEKVVATLDQVTTLISLRKKQLAKLDELIKARFVEMIQDEPHSYIRLKDIVEADRIITYGLVKPGASVSGGIPIIKVKDFPNGTILHTDFLYADRNLESKYARSRVKTGDLLYSIRGTVGRTAFVPSTLEGANITQDTARLSVDRSRFHPQYVKYALNYSSVVCEIEKHIKGVAMRGISLSDLREIEIPVTSFNIQNQFGQFVEQTDKSKLSVQNSLDQLETLKKALMQKYFG